MNGLYNMVHGYNPACVLILPMLGNKPDFYPRFRDCFVNIADDGTREIHVFTRVGSLNQGDDYGEEKLYKEPTYLRFEDLEEDATYGTYIFKCPEEWEKDFDAIVNGNLQSLSENYFEMQKKFWGDGGDSIVSKIKDIAKSLPKKE